MDINKGKCMLCAKKEILNHNLITVEIPILKQKYLICKDCYEYIIKKNIERLTNGKN